MSCVAADEHERIIRGVKLWHLKVHAIWAVLVLACLYLPYHYKVQSDRLRDEIRTFQMGYSSIRARHHMLEMLRSRPLTLGQAMDLTDSVIQQNNVPVEVVLAVMKQESEFKPEAVSSKGAKGLMQVMPVVWKSYSLPHFKNVTDPVQNVHVGTRYLADLYQQFGDWKSVFRAYYAGPQNHNNREYDWYANAVMKKIAEFQKEMKN
ncbi:MAG TPA: lytic transglycosylase domain-containing protein [Thermodesulfobacteriota bacterium]|nr:lytic transglycosylase domain-containing protein [Thermodesulfobacteriota bacterium]